jgi:hypothetical protein
MWDVLTAILGGVMRSIKSSLGVVVAKVIRKGKGFGIFAFENAHNTHLLYGTHLLHVVRP